MGLDPEDIKQLIAILQKGLTDNDDQKASTSPQVKSNKGDITTNKGGRRRRHQPEHINMFVDMPESKMHKDDAIIDQKLKKFPPTPRSRHATIVDVKCRVCGKEESVSSKILPESKDRYKCNKCATSGG